MPRPRSPRDLHRRSTTAYSSNAIPKAKPPSATPALRKCELPEISVFAEAPALWRPPMLLVIAGVKPMNPPLLVVVGPVGTGCDKEVVVQVPGLEEVQILL